MKALVNIACYDLRVNDLSEDRVPETLVHDVMREGGIFE